MHPVAAGCDSLANFTALTAAACCCCTRVDTSNIKPTSHNNCHLLLPLLPPLLQTCIVVAISVCGATLGAAFQCILLTAACGVAQTLLGVFKPFAFREANLVSMQAFGCLVLSAQAVLVFELLVMADGSTAAAANGVAAFVLFVNILFVLSVLWRVVTAVDWAGLGGTAGKVGKAAAAKLGGCGGGSAGSGGCWGRARPPAV